jgi:hypothetical protein
MQDVGSKEDAEGDGGDLGPSLRRVALSNPLDAVSLLALGCFECYPHRRRGWRARLERPIPSDCRALM